MNFTKEQLLGKKIRYNGEEQWQQIVDACAAVGIPVGTECSLWTPHSGNNKDFDCKILGYQKDSSGDSLVWVEKLDCPSHEDPFKTYLLSKVTFSKIKPKSWQEVLCDEYNLELDKENWTFHLSRGFTESNLIRFAKRIIELSEKSSQK